MTPYFWETKSLDQLSDQQWESLCDGCAQCCLQKLEDMDTREVYVTQISCGLLDLKTCQCTDYQNRSELVPTCITMKPKDARDIKWMPSTCAYRLLAEGQDLPQWHPLISGRKESVMEADVSIKDKAISENDVAESDWPDYIVERLP